MELSTTQIKISTLEMWSAQLLRGLCRYSLDGKLYYADQILTLEVWSVHSLRVRACVIILSMGMSTTQITSPLRWRSDAFMVDLRNTAIIATSQNATFIEADATPHLSLSRWSLTSSCVISQFQHTHKSKETIGFDKIVNEADAMPHFI
jgi:hypothetical protein